MKRTKLFLGLLAVAWGGMGTEVRAAKDCYALSTNNPIEHDWRCAGGAVTTDLRVTYPKHCVSCANNLWGDAYGIDPATWTAWCARGCTNRITGTNLIHEVDYSNPDWVLTNVFHGVLSSNLTASSAGAGGSPRGSSF